MPRFLRISRARFRPDRAGAVAALLDEARRTIWPKQVALPGYLGGAVGLDRRNGAMVWATTWDSAEHGDALGELPEMIASGRAFRAEKLVFEPITTHELLDEGPGPG